MVCIAVDEVQGLPPAKAGGCWLCAPAVDNADADAAVDEPKSLQVIPDAAVFDESKTVQATGSQQDAPNGIRITLAAASRRAALAAAAVHQSEASTNDSVADAGAVGAPAAAAAAPELAPANGTGCGGGGSRWSGESGGGGGSRIRGSPLQKALLSGKIPEAFRLLNAASSAAAEGLSENDEKRIRRLYAMYKEALPLFEGEVTDMSVHSTSAHGYNWGWDLKDGVATFRSTIVVPDVSLKAAIGAHFEVDVQGDRPFEQSARLKQRRRSSFLGGGFAARATRRMSTAARRSIAPDASKFSGRQSVMARALKSTHVAPRRDVSGWNHSLSFAEELVDPNGASNLEAIWKLHSEISKAKHEAVVRISVVDGIAEPLGAVLLFVRSLDAAESKLFPPPEAGVERDSMDAILAFTPMAVQDGLSGAGGLRIKRRVSVRLSKAMQRLSRWTPEWLLRSAVDKSVRQEMELMGPFLRDSDVLARALVTSPRAPLYAHLSAIYDGDEAEKETQRKPQSRLSGMSVVSADN